MLSAYRHGNLKKDPLLGTSLAADPTRNQMRTDFLDLYGQAKSAGPGTGRTGMLTELADRYARLGSETTPRLSQIQQEEGDIQKEAASYQDPKEAARLSTRGTSAAKYLQDIQTIKKGKKRWRLNNDYKNEIDAAWNNLPADDPMKVTAGGDKDRFTSNYLTKMMKDYSDYTLNNQSRLQNLNTTRYEPLIHEDKQIRQKLQDRADLYNAFLGID